MHSRKLVSGIVHNADLPPLPGTDVLSDTDLYMLMVRISACVAEEEINRKQRIDVEALIFVDNA